MRTLNLFYSGLFSVMLFLCSTVNAQTIDPFYAGSYSVTNLGGVPGLPTDYGSLVFKQGDPQTLLIAGEANDDTAGIFEITVDRNLDGHIIGFLGNATRIANAPGSEADSGIDGGLDYGPDMVLFYTTYDDNHVGQIRPGSMDPDRLIDLSPLGVNPSTGALGFVPAGFPGAGHLKIVSYDSADWYDATVTPDGAGTFNIVGLTPIVTLADNGQEGFAYVHAGNPLFAIDSLVEAEFSEDWVVTFEIDGNGDPLPATRRVLVMDIDGPEDCAVDPISGDLIVSSINDNLIYSVQGFMPPDCLVDSDSDGTADCNDGCPQDGAKTEPGACGCGTSDADADGNGTPDCNDASDPVMLPGPPPGGQSFSCCAPGVFPTIALFTPVVLVTCRYRSRRRRFRNRPAKNCGPR